MSAAVHLALSVTVYDDGDGGVPLLSVVGLPDVPELWATIDERGIVRALWRVRGLPPRLSECPIAPGLPSLAAVCRGALA